MINILKKTIGSVWIMVFLYVLTVLFFFEKINPSNLISNIYSFLLIIPLFLLFCIFRKKNINISNKKYICILLIINIILFIIQFIVVKYGTFYTGWDASVIREYVNKFFSKGTLGDTTYLTRYPNNLFLVFIFSIIKKFPIIGSRYSFTLLINCFLVNASCILSSLVIRRLTKDNFLAIISYFIMIPLIMLNPWFLIPYSDTFAILFPILVVYIYIKSNKKIYDWFFIWILSIIGYLIKPTVIFVLFSILIFEIINNFKKESLTKKKQILLSGIFLIVGIIFGFGLKYVAVGYLKYTPKPGVVEFNYKHFLAMGQNNETHGVYSEKDVTDSKRYGMDQNVSKFINRVKSRTLSGQLDFFTKKTLLNFNLPAFAWGREGHFYTLVPQSKSRITDCIRDIYYENGTYYKIFLHASQFFLLFTLSFCLFIKKKQNTNNEIVIMMSILMLIVFLTVFEARTRYLYCYSPLFVVCSVIGANSLCNKISKRNSLIKGDIK